MKSYVSPLVVLSLAATVICGCAANTQPLPGETFQPKYYPVCFDPIAQLIKDDRRERREEEQAVGNSTGLMAAWNVFAHRVAGYFYTDLDEVADQEERLAKFQARLGDDGKGLTLKQASVLSSYRCYQDQLAELQKNKNKMSRRDLEARVNEIRTALDILRQYSTALDEEIDQQTAQADRFLQQQQQQAGSKKQKARVKQAQSAAEENAKQREDTKSDVKQAEKEADEAIDALLA